MIKQFADPAWWSDFQTQINADDQFASSAKYFNVRVGIKTPEGSWTIDARDGKVVSVQSGLALTGDDIVLIGPDSEWNRILDGKTDWFEATSPGLGQLTFEGNMVAALRNIKPMWRLLMAMSKAGKAPAVPGPFSPDPVPSGREILGKYVDVKGLRAHYEEAGQGQPIVCIHAACQDTLMYRHVLDGPVEPHQSVRGVQRELHGSPGP